MGPEIRDKEGILRCIICLISHCHPLNPMSSLGVYSVSKRKLKKRPRKGKQQIGGEEYVLTDQERGFLTLIWGNGFVPEAQRGLSEIKNPLRVCNALITSEVTMNFVVGILGRI